MPFWELASQLKHLYIRNIHARDNQAQSLLPDFFGTHDEEAMAAVHGLQEPAQQLDAPIPLADELEDDEQQVGGIESGQEPQLDVQIGGVTQPTRLDGEVLEEELAAFELPSSFIASTTESARQFNHAVAARTVAAAAKGGKLKSLKFLWAPVHKPFAVRALIPFWLDIDEWRLDTDEYDEEGKCEYWAHEAITLRNILAYASLHLNARADRLLTRESVRDLIRHSDDEALKNVARRHLEGQWFPTKS